MLKLFFSQACFLVLCTLANFFSTASVAGTSGSVSGTVLDQDGIAVGGAHVKILSENGSTLFEKTTGAAGDFEAYPLDFGNYTVVTEANDFNPNRFSLHIASGANAELKIQLKQNHQSSDEPVMTVKVQAKRNLVSGTAPSSTREINKETIQALPQGDDIKLPKLLATTNPGIIQGPFGQSYIRGNHANIQYQIDGVQLPDSPSNTFGQAFSPRNIDHMEVITGGIPAEYGERLSAVVNIITKSGSETPGGTVGIGYGAYNTLTPQGSYSGSNSAGNFHYFLSASYTQTDRGLETPQPQSLANPSQGTSDAVHDQSNGNDEFIKLDWQLGNTDKLSFITYNSYNFYQIPNFPASFSATSPIFNSGYSDPWQNGPLNYVPYNTNDAQAENNAYSQLVWKHSFSPHAFLQLAPYFKISKIHVLNDPTNDLYAANAGAIPNSNPSSFAEDRVTLNEGIKGDFSDRWNDSHLIKAGFQLQQSNSSGPISVISQEQGQAPVYSSDNNEDTGYLESVYLQDEYKLTHTLTLSAGLRFDATQYHFSDVTTQDSWLQPRLGLSYKASENTVFHVFYGLSFQPAPVENLRDTFVNIGAGNALAPYDIKAEKDNYAEVGASHQWNDQVMNLNIYGKLAKNMLDDSQLLNTSIAQPYNFSHGYAYGVEFSIQGKLNQKWADYFNYSYEIAKGSGISGGLFSFPTGTSASTGGYQFLDHVQVHTANSGVTYKTDHWWWTGEALFGSGLRTGPNNTLSLPSHLTFDTSIGYDFSQGSWWSKTKLSVDLLNILDNLYPINVANGYNGNHYSAGREIFARISKEL